MISDHEQPDRKHPTLDDSQIMRLAEQTDVSPNQAKELLERFDYAEALKQAKRFKAEG